MYNDLTGRRFGRLVVRARAPDHITASGYHHVMWLCDCDCGNEKIIRGKSLIAGYTKSCGCLQREGISSRAGKHHGFGTRLYAIWNSMRQRCNNPNHHAYANYGGRGITICSEWNDFSVFRGWALNSGYDPDAVRGECTLDRINVEEGYSPENCRWVNMCEQSRNKRDTIYIELHGEAHSLSEWSDILGIKYQTLWKRYKRGNSIIK